MLDFETAGIAATLQQLTRTHADSHQLVSLPLSTPPGGNSPQPKLTISVEVGIRVTISPAHPPAPPPTTQVPVVLEMTPKPRLTRTGLPDRRYNRGPARSDNQLAGDARGAVTRKRCDHA